MGDVFEHMLDEIQTSGKNGQFRTPRHIIRFMIELLDPKLGDSIVDPAAGTCGFLINSILHLRKKDTPKENLRLEWDGTPHNAHGSNPALEKALKGKLFTGFENDQTMARIGWMNMVLHGIEKPNIIWRDSLSKKLSDEESNSYDFAFANPPYTGSVDRSDLHESPQRFPRTNKGPITDKSELLFVWLILDLLRIGGEAAVIVPEGVLFGSTGAHRELRRQLLMENRLKAVISLPAGVFQPYTGVKTSILVFQKMNEKPAKGEDPTTKEVWFYEITADGRSLDARRNQRPEENDLWDAQEKYERWFDKSDVVEPTDYFKPDYFMERWRDVDEKTLQIFPELAHERDKREGIHELFPELDQNPAQATEQVSRTQAQRIVALYQRYLSAAQFAAVAAADAKQTDEQKRDAVQRIFDRYAKDLDRLFREVADQMLESLPEKAGFKNYANAALKFVRDEVQQDFNRQSATLVTQILEDSDFMLSLRMLDGETPQQTLAELHDAAQPEVETILREFAKLDGYDVLLRSHELSRFEELLPEGLNWSAQARVWWRNDEWTNEDSTLTGSHDEDGRIRREYLEDENLYNKDGTVKAEFLEPDCIEANDLNIAAGRYKPFTFKTVKVDSPVKVIEELQELETKIQQGLERLKSMIDVSV
jgi:type I restriction enzyme M protein